MTDLDAVVAELRSYLSVMNPVIAKLVERLIGLQSPAPAGWKEAADAYEREFALWGVRVHLPPRDGAGIDAWIEAQRASTYDLVRDGEMVEAGLPNALSTPEFFERRRLAAAQACVLAASPQPPATAPISNAEPQERGDG